jgi:hypothetical protein
MTCDKGVKLASSEEWGEYGLETQLTHEPLWIELFNQIADRFRTLWPIVSAMQTRDSLLRCSHCALAISVLIVVINEWIRDLEF